MNLSIDTHSIASAIDDTVAAVERMTFFSTRTNEELPVTTLIFACCRYDLSVCARRWRTCGKEGLKSMAHALSDLVESCDRRGCNRAADEARDLRDEFFTFASEWFRWN